MLKTKRDPPARVRMISYPILAFALVEVRKSISLWYHYMASHVYGGDVSLLNAIIGENIHMFLPNIASDLNVSAHLKQVYGVQRSSV